MNADARWAGAAAVLVLLAACGTGEGSDSELGSVERGGEQVVADSDLSSAGSTVIAIVGDAGELNDDTLEVAALVHERDVEAVFTVGDNEYVTEGRTVEAYDESVGEVYGRWLAAGSFFPIPGDHDYGDRCDDPDAPVDLDAYVSAFELSLIHISEPTRR